MGSFNGLLKDPFKEDLLKDPSKELLLTDPSKELLVKDPAYVDSYVERFARPPPPPSGFRPL